MARARGAAVGIALALSCALAPAAMARDATGPEAAAMLSAQREAHGIPGAIQEVPAWSDGCRKHMEWVAQNGLEHDEQPGTPGYTPEGDEAGNSSVLSGEPWEFGGPNPWEFAPIHLMQLLGPELSKTGYANGCMWTWPGYQRPDPAQPRLFSYPGDGTRGWRHREQAFESPYTPGERVGLAGDAVTGPYLYVLAWGAGRGKITSASLTGPGGPVEIRVADNTTDGLEGFLPPGGMLIPVKPLAQGTLYEATARFEPREPAGPALNLRWSFSTEGGDGAQPDLLDPETSVALGTLVSAASRSAAPVQAGIARGGATLWTGTLTPGTSRRHHLPPGVYAVCHAQEAMGAYAAVALTCAERAASFEPPLRLRRRGRKLLISTRSRAARGLRAKLRTRGGRGPQLRRSFRLGTKAKRIKLPRGAAPKRVVVRTKRTAALDGQAWLPAKAGAKLR